ncbi:phage terminase large subunit family protein [Methylococcus sp. EFPC2]|uniref:phage terminase large subunit family protein n=1 Tax=Methylococcus sp. EFPC2 TaxID=2812648 RepID=UPI0019681625|nr:terminase gpA endonuclease subunit [Methylococcus sp. EFPC2]QSA97133.1 phage terminase large subunit family protein [Methylococcus sp. EFPC2]
MQLDAAIYSDGATAYREAFGAGLRPDPPLWVDEWSEQHMVIPKSSGAAEPGRYRVERTPYAREPMRALSPEHPALKVVIKGASQLLKTQVALNFVCSVIDRQPANVIVLEPTDKLARRVAARFDKITQEVAPLTRKVAKRKHRDSKNSAETKEFEGGTAWFLSARSASNLSEASARYVVVDEVDRILREIKGEGDTVGLVEKRQTTYGRKAKGLYISSPTEEDASRIEELYREGNQHQYHVPCPHCGELQALEWENFFYELNAEGRGRAWMVCIRNGCIIEEHAKPVMLPDVKAGGRAEWIPSAPGNGETWSYEISSLYAPLGWVSWLALAREYDEAKKAADIGDREKLQVFYNTRLARTWSSKNAVVKPEKLREKAEAYPLGIVPMPALSLTATVDVQGNRLECQIVGWGPGPTGLEAWIVGTHILYGDPTLREVWSELDELLKTPVRHASGALFVIRAVGIDSGDGDSTQEVYEFCRPRSRRYVAGKLQAVLAVKGASQAKKPVIAGSPSKVEYNYRGKPIMGGTQLWNIGTDTAKDWIYNRLNLAGQIAIHTSDQLPIQFYEQLLSEAKTTRWVKGKRRTSYELIKRGSRNEQLDLMVYNLAMANFLGLDRYTAERWEKLRAALVQIDLLTELDAQPVASAQPADAQPPAIPPPAKLPPATQARGRRARFYVARQR